MDIKGFVEKAKGAAVAAANKAREVAANVAEQAKTAAGDTPEQARDVAVLDAEQAEGIVPAIQTDAVAAPDAQQVAVTSTDRFSELKKLGSEKIQELIASFQQSLPAIEMAGYELTEFEIELGITPKLIPHFRHAHKNSEDIDCAREALRENKLGTLILGGLLKAGEVHQQIKVAGFCFTHIEIELGLIPSIRLQYKNEGLGAALR
jgi:hypothetical protein